MNDAEFRKRYLAARKKVIAADFRHLNDMQREAVMTTEGPLLLLAGAGSGKTTVLIHRIANILKYGRASDCDEIPERAGEEELLFLEEYAENPTEDGRRRAEELSEYEPCEPWRVIAITFTNKAAGELKSRLERMIGSSSRDVWAMTFHAACVRILRRDIDKLGFDRSFTIYDTTDSQALIKRIVKELNLDDKTYPHKTVLGYISRAKDDMVSAEDFADAAEKSGDLRRRQIGRIYLEYAKRMRAANALDFDDLIWFTVRLFMEDQDVLSHYQMRFRYVLIDEYQDTNNLQYRFASLLAGGYENICVVGDDDQSIYKFRGATIENILSFESKYKNARVIRLEQNYRSTSHILAAANDVISNNVGRKGKTLWTERGEGEKLILYVAPDEREEAAYVARQIIAGAAEGKRWCDYAVLYRMNAQSNQIENAFKRSGIPYRIVGGTRFFDRAEIKDILAYLCVIANPDDDLRLGRIINNPPRGIGQRTVELLRDVASEYDVSMFHAILNAETYDALAPSAGKLHRFADLILDLRELSAAVRLDDLYDLIVERTGYVRMLGEKATDENLTRIENVNELKSNIINFLNENGEGGLDGFLAEISLYTDIDQYDGGADCVVMMTMHSAKGLEFDTVFIVGAEEGIFPGLRSIGEQSEMEEERRLCYVAMTRAKRKLYFTGAQQRTLFGHTTAGMVSRFVGEVGDENIEKPEEPNKRVTEYRFDDYFDDDSDAYGASPGGRGDRGYGASKRREFVKRAPRRAPLRSPAQSEPQETYHIGDTISHKAFGNGTIVDMRPAGNDALLEVDFDSAGKKRLMLKSASAYMRKV